MKSKKVHAKQRTEHWSSTYWHFQNLLQTMLSGWQTEPPKVGRTITLRTRSFATTANYTGLNPRLGHVRTASSSESRQRYLHMSEESVKHMVHFQMHSKTLKPSISQQKPTQK